AILGSGIMGSALSVPLADNGHDVRLVGTHLDRDIIEGVRTTGVHPGLKLKLPESVRPYQLESLDEALDGAEIVLSGVNSFGVSWAGQQLASRLKPGMLVIAIAKGMEATEQGDLRILLDVLADQVTEEVRSQVSWAAIVGPSIAGELAARRQTCVVFAGHDQDALDRLASTFRTDYYHIWTSTDVVGAEVCAAMKNCYALSVGFPEGLLERMGETESPYRSYNFAARPETVLGLPGVGDMYVTSTGGRNVRAGRLVGTGLTFTEAHERLNHVTMEGAAAIRVIGGALDKLTARGVVQPADFPLMRHLYQVIGKDQPLAIPWDGLFPVRPAAGR
nr:glycerol-3-phosphate dehydrogenase [Candidatus Dormibacteraeota bacterium]